MYKIMKAQALLGIGFIILSACSHDKESNREEGSTIPPIIVNASLPSTSDNESLNISGKVEAAHTATISTRLMGFITKINVKVGDKVHEGQQLVTISSQDIHAKKAQATAMLSGAEAALKNAQKDYERYSNLLKRGSATAKEMENISLQYSSAKSQVEAARQMVKEADAMLQYSNLTAPFSGVITQKLSDVGNMANPGIPILALEQNGNYQVKASIPEIYISKVKEGDVVNMDIKSTGKLLQGKISELSQSSEATGGQYLAKIAIPESEYKGLYAGMYVNVSIPVKNNEKNAEQNEMILVPEESIIHKDQLTGIYTISHDNKALLRWVRLGKTYGDKVEVISGLDKNEQFITHADGKLFNGSPVKIQQ